MLYGAEFGGSSVYPCAWSSAVSRGAQKLLPKETEGGEREDRGREEREGEEREGEEREERERREEEERAVIRLMSSNCCSNTKP